MNTIEPIGINGDRYTARRLRNKVQVSKDKENTIEEYINKVRKEIKNREWTFNIVEEDNESLIRIERERNEWFTNILKKESISNREEDRRRLLEEINIFGYMNIGPIKIGRRLFNILYWLKLIKL